jgi:response regulator RpfG family c-di-GMP phosphodiesterase
MSGRTDLHVLKQAINVAGIYHFIGKPWEATELRLLINEALNYRRLLLH